MVSSSGLRVGQVRIVFKLPNDLLTRLFGTTNTSIGPLIFVDWFSRPAARPEKHHNMYRISRSTDIKERESAIVDLSSVRRSCHLFPLFPKGKVGKTAAAGWTSGNVLEQCSTFFINNFVDMHAFQTIF